MSESECAHNISVFPEKSVLDEVKSLSTVIVNDMVYMHVYTYSGVGTGRVRGATGPPIFQQGGGPALPAPQ